jgi:DNA-binding Lrp family transcriptional regulator
MAKAYVLISNESGAEDSIIRNLNRIDSIDEAHGTFGAYDIITKLHSDKMQKLENDISNSIRKIPKIRSTLTLLVNEKETFSKINEIEKKVLEKHMVQAFIIIHCNTSNEITVLNKLKEISEVVEADILIGSFEILCAIVAPTYDEISDIVSNKIRKISNIKSTITLNVIENQGFRK